MQQKLVWTVIGAALVGLLIGAGGMALLNGKNSSKDNSSAATPTPTPSTATATIRPTSTSTPSPTTTSASTSACATSNLNVALTNNAGGGAAGSVYYSLDFTNKGTKACTLMGYPGVSMVNGAGTQIGNPADRATDKPVTTLTLQPGGKVSSTLRVVNNNFGPGVCKDGATSLKVYPPNQTASVTIPASLTTWCPGFSVTAVFGT